VKIRRRVMRDRRRERARLRQKLRNGLVYLCCNYRVSACYIGWVTWYESPRHKIPRIIGHWRDRDGALDSMRRAAVVAERIASTSKN